MLLEKMRLDNWADGHVAVISNLSCVEEAEHLEKQTTRLSLMMAFIAAGKLGSDIHIEWNRLKRGAE